jgi:uncharacterized protein (DUF302 family)
MASTEPTRDDTMIITKRSPRSVADTVERFKDILRTRSVKVFAVIDQSAEARGAGLQLRETTLVIFGNPLQGTPVMIASPLAALDLPLKIVVWADNEQTSVSYYAPGVLQVRHGLDPDLARNLAGIDALTDALVAA